MEGPIGDGRDSFLAVARRSVIDEVGPCLYGRDVPIRFYDVTARYSRRGENATCSLTGMRTYDRGQINPTRNFVLSWSNTVLGGRCLFFGEGLGHAIEVQGGYTHFHNQAGPPDAPRRSASVRKGYLSINSDRELFGTTLNYGTRWTLNNYPYDLDEPFTQLQKRDRVGGAIQAHASLEWTAGEWLTVTPSIGTHLTTRRLLTPTYEPRLRVTLRPTGSDRQEISAAFGKYNQMAEGLTDERDAGTVFTAWRPSGSDEPLLQALHAILGYRQQIGQFLTVNVEGYVKDLANVPAPKWSPVARFDVETALADGLAYGADFRTEFETESLYLFLGYGWSTVRYSAARDDLGAWAGGEVVEYYPPHDRRHQLNLVASYEIGDFTVDARWGFGSGRPYTQVAGFDLALEIRDQKATHTKDYPSLDAGTAEIIYERPYDARLPTYHQLDVSLGRSFDLSSRLTMETEVGAINAYDRSNIFYYDISTFERVNQTPLLPYLSVSVDVE
jgi:hypothetical protein